MRQASTTVYEPDGFIVSDGGYFYTSSLLQPPPVDQPPVEQPPVFQPPVDQPPTEFAGAAFGGVDLEAEFEQAVDQVLAGRPVEGVTQAERQATGGSSSDVGDLLQRSNTTQNVNAQRRAQTAFLPNIRGFRDGQIYTQADGAYWLPARQDLDTILNKLDPADIQDVVVIPGPYGLRYGPGFSFIDVVRIPTPRYDCPQVHNRFGMTYLTNGDQLYGRNTVFGGGQDYGFRINYGHRIGSDYEAGNGEDIPASYKARHVVADMGYDLSPYQRLEFNYLRLDQTDTEYYLQFFDIDYLVTDGFNLRLVDEDPAGPWSRLVVEGWWNRTRFEGDTLASSKATVRGRVGEAVGRSPTVTGAGVTGGVNFNALTDGDVISSGARIASTFGELDDPHLTVGTDFRYIQQNINERFFLTAVVPGQQAALDQVFDPQNQFPDETFATNLPNSWLRNPGVFAEFAVPIGFWTPAIGARADFVDTSLRPGDLRQNTQLTGMGDRSQSDTLYAFYFTNELQLDRNWTGRISFGHAQRPPTLTERYADAIFLGVAQSGFTRVIGTPGLSKERNWQIDAGLHANYGRWRGSMTGFHSWVLDYITFDSNPVLDPTGARLLRYTNTEYATLVGFTLATEYDLTPRLTPFATMAYIDGRDREIDQPLPQIWPLDSRVGVRVHDPFGGRYWGVEFFARIVDNQDRLGTIRQGQGVSILEQPTPGFTVWELRSYYNVTDNLSITGGIHNVFDRTYLEHLDLRLPADVGFPAEFAFRPGFTPYIGLEWIF